MKEGGLFLPALLEAGMCPSSYQNLSLVNPSFWLAHGLKEKNYKEEQPGRGGKLGSRPCNL